MTTQEKPLITFDVAARFFYLAEQGEFDLIQDELYSEDAVSIEPQGSFLPSADSLDKIREKAETWKNMTLETHSLVCGQPIVAGDYFATSLSMDVTLKDQGRIKMDEIAVYKVVNGKIVSEQFFF